MKKIIKIMLLFALCVLFIGCDFRIFEVPIHQPTENIVRIELYKHNIDGEDFYLYTIEDDIGINAFIDELKKLECKRKEPATGDYYLSSRIFYSDGYVDIIGDERCTYTHIDEKNWDGKEGWLYVRDQNAFRRIFSLFVSEDELPPER